VVWNGQTGDLHALQKVFARPTQPATWRITPDYTEIKGTSLWLWGDKTPELTNLARLSLFATHSSPIFDQSNPSFAVRR
jgi:hypothetical protein